MLPQRRASARSAAGPKEAAMTDAELKDRSETRSDANIRFYGVHHLALNTEDMKMTVDFYAGVLGMRLVHAMKVPPGLGTGPGNRGNPPFEEVRHYFFDMGRDGLLAFFEMPKGKKQQGDRNALGAMQRRCRMTARWKSCPASSQSMCSTQTTSGWSSPASRATAKASL